MRAATDEQRMRHRILLSARRGSQLLPLRNLLVRQPDLHVLGESLGLRETFNATESAEPDLVIVASDLTAQSEFEALTRLFAALDARWLEYALPAEAGAGGDNSRAPGGDLFRIQAASAPEAILGQVRAVLNRPRRRSKAAGSETPPSPARNPAPRHQRLVLIGSSTGGVEALLRVLSSFPVDCPPTAIVQHTGAGYGDGLTRLLDRNCAAEVVAAQDGLALLPGRVILAAGCGAHMHLTPGSPPVAKLSAGSPVAGHCPSVDTLFRSGVAWGKGALGVLLTGMGSDGAEGLLALRQAGAATLAQDEASSLVYGMPKAAWNKGAVDQRVHIDRMAEEILRLARVGADRGAGSG